MKNLLCVITSLLLVASCQKNQAVSGFIVNGIVKNMPDSTKVVMYLNTETILDTAMVMNEEFQFQGHVERPTKVVLRIESTRDTKTFWLENNTITISGEKGNMRHSNVAGSQTQKEADILKQRKDSIYKEMEELGKMVTDNNRDSLFVVYEKMIDEEVKINQSFIKDYPNSYESLTVLHQSTMKKLGAKETHKLFSKLSKALQLTKEGKSISRFIDLNKNPKIGDKFVDFEQLNNKGEAIKISEVKGKYTLIEFWASWCGPCRAFNPELVKEYKLYKAKGFEIVGISLDSNKERWLKAIENDGLIWQNISDLKGLDNEAAIIYGISAIPDNFLIDENGVIIARYLRGDNLKQKLKELFTKDVTL